LQAGVLLQLGSDEAKKQKERETEEKNALSAEFERQQVEGKEVSEDDARGAPTPAHALPSRDCRRKGAAPPRGGGG